MQLAPMASTASMGWSGTFGMSIQPCSMPPACPSTSNLPGKFSSGCARMTSDGRWSVVQPSHAACQLGIEGIAQAVPDQVDGQDRQSQTEAREQHNPEGNLHVGAAFGHDIAPTGDDGRGASAQEAEVRLENDGRGADVRALHDQGC